MDCDTRDSFLHSAEQFQVNIDFLECLPLEIIEQILGFLCVEDCLRCCCVSKAWNNIVSSLNVWKKHFYGVSICKPELHTHHINWKQAFTKAKQLEMTLLSPSYFHNTIYTLKKQNQTVYLGHLHQKFVIGSLKCVEYDNEYLLIVSELGYVWLWSDVHNLCPTSMNVKALWRLRENSLVMETRFSASKRTIVFLLSNSHVVVTNFQGVKSISWNCTNGNYGVKTICYSPDLNTLVTVEDNEVRVWKILKDCLRQMISFRYDFPIPRSQKGLFVAHWKEGRHLVILNPQFWIPELTDTDDGYGLSVVANTNHFDNIYPNYVSSYFLRNNVLYLHSLVRDLFIFRDLDRNEAVESFEANCKGILAIGEKMWMSYGHQRGVTRGYKNSMNCYKGFNLSVGYRKQKTLEKKRKRALCCLKWLDGLSWTDVVKEWKQQLVSANIRGQDVELVWFVPPKDSYL